MASSSTSSCLLAVAVLATLFAGAWCLEKVSFTVEKGSDASKLAVAVKYDKEGDEMSEVEIREKGSSEWLAMKNAGDGVWKIESSKKLKGPFNIRFETKKGLRGVFDDIIPADFKEGTTYTPEE